MGIYTHSNVAVMRHQAEAARQLAHMCRAAEEQGLAHVLRPASEVRAMEIEASRAIEIQRIEYLPAERQKPARRRWFWFFEFRIAGEPIFSFLIRRGGSK